MTITIDPYEKAAFRAASLFQPDAIVVHYTESDDVSAAVVDRWHEKRGFIPRGINPLRYIGYHALIRKDGTIEAGRSLDVQGTHCLGHNLHTWAVCLAGSDKMIWYPNFEQYHSLAAWCENRMDEAKIPKSRIFFHRDLNSTSCPGRLDKAFLLSLISYPDSFGKEDEEMIRTSDKVDKEHHFTDVWTSKYELQYLHIQGRGVGETVVEIFATKDIVRNGEKAFAKIHKLTLKPTADNPNPYVKIPLDTLLDKAGFADCAVSVHATQPVACALREEPAYE